MTEDARFEEGADLPVRLAAVSADDVPVLSAILQDAVFTATDVRWRPRQRQAAFLLNRFRWEDSIAARAQARPFERVRSVLALSDARAMDAQGIDPRDGDTVLSLLSLTFEPEGDGAGTFLFTLAGDGALRVRVECINATLSDVTRPYVAPSGKAPTHDP